MGRNRTAVDAVIPLRQSNGDRQRDTKAPCGYDSRKQVRQVTSLVIGIDAVHAIWPKTNHGGNIQSG